MKMEYMVPFVLFLHLCLGQALTVVVPPDSPAAIEVGQNVTLKANPNGTIEDGTWVFETTTILLWYPGRERPDPQYKNRIFFNASDASLTLTSLQVDDSGQYALNGFKADGNQFRREFVLFVQVPISHVTMTVSDTNLIEFNDTVTLNCSASGTPLWFQWINGTSVVTASDRVQFNNERNVLTIKPVTRFDTGPFSCNGFNNVSQEHSWSVHLNISYGPSNLMLEVAPDKMAYVSGSSVTLTCTAESKPAASYMWLFNDTLLNKVGRLLELTDLQINKTGQYTCLVHNSLTSRYEKISRSLTIVDPISAVVVNKAGPPILNMTFTLSCDVTGPVDSIHWMKSNIYLPADNRISTSNNNATLTLTPVEMSDNGTYSCMAFNVASNKTSNDYTLTVNYGPRMPVILGPSIIATASNLMLSCSAASWPPSNFTWYFNGLLVKEGPDYKVDNLSLSNSGNYTCSAHNDITNITKIVTKEVKVIDLISSATIKITGNPPVDHKRFMLTCEAIGAVYDRYWMTDGMALNLNMSRMSLSEDNSTLTFNPVLTSDNGSYTCMASNPLSRATSPMFSLKVNYGPKTPVITGPMQPVKAGSNVTLNCNAASEPPSNYTWHFKNRMESGSMYVINEATSSDSGNYTCVAKNDVTKQNSSSFKELVVIDPISAVMIMEGEPPILNMTFTLSCNVTGPVDFIHWMINSSSYLQSNDRIYFSNGNRTLTFKPVDHSDNGGYQCVAMNAVSKQNSSEYMLMVNYGPDNVSISGPSILATGSNATFTCDASSWPPSSISWFYNGSQVGMSSVSKKYSLSPADSGEYICTAHNNKTDLSSSAAKLLTVIDLISSATIKITGNPPVDHKRFMLTCEAIGAVYDRYWMTDGMALNLNMSRMSLSEDNSTLTFNPVLTSDNGNYMCMASNPLNSATSPMFSLKVNYGPKMPVITGPMQPVKAGYNVTLNCNAASEPPSNYTWHFKNRMESGSMYVINEATSSDSGNYTCVAKNDVTKQNSSTFKELVVIDPISAVMMMEGEPPILNMTFTLSCNVTGPVDFIHWMINSSSYLQSNDRIYFSNERKTLTFKHVDHSDNGDYQCVAMNAVSKLNSSEYMLMVNYGPWDTVITGPQVAEPGSDVTFHCSATSSPPSAYSWYYNGSMIGEGAQLELPNLTFNESGEYTCKAHNNKTSMDSSASINLRVIPPLTVVTIETDGQLPILGSSFKCNCSANGETTSIYWMKNGMYLSWNGTVSFSEDNVTMTIASVMHDDNGDYQCTAINDVSEKTSQMYNLRLNFGPNNVSISGPKLAETGENVTFNCSATSWPPSGFSWYFSGSWVADGSSYTTEPLALKGRWNYTCMAHNNVTGLYSSASMELMVLDAINSIVVKPKPVIPMDSENFLLYCDIAGPHDSIKWIRDSQPLIYNNTVTISKNSTTVSFKPLRTANDGLYQCVAENIVKQHFSEPYNLRASYGPSDVLITSTQNPFTLTCQADSQPPSEYEWIINNELKGNTSSIEMTLFTALALDTIMCKAKNPRTNETVTATFIIPDVSAAAPPSQSRVDLILTVLLALSLCLLGNRFY
ncbi:hemicentin-1-like [Alosa pseudoharengus]|uniref:hemicentin-1-like n=1 Tax=Alosa pseudoharengus TaxID=34774 RepID=UPI003F8BA762